MADRKRKLDIYEAPPVMNPAAAAVPGVGNGVAPGINPYTGKAYSQRYYQILNTRQGGRARGTAGHAPALAACLGSCRLVRPTQAAG